MKTPTETTSSSNSVAIAVTATLLAVSIGLYLLKITGIPVMVIMVIVSLLIGSSIKIADQWEKAVVLRMGKYSGLKGPGLFFIIPILDQISTFIDQRVRVTEFRAEQTLTKDTVPVNVDAVVYWTVWDVEKAALEVQEYVRANIIYSTD